MNHLIDPTYRDSDFGKRHHLSWRERTMLLLGITILPLSEGIVEFVAAHLMPPW